jgi:hypothetical protein
MPTEEEQAQIDQHLAVGGNGIVTLPEGMTQEEADRLVAEADEAQAIKDAEWAAQQEQEAQ